MTHLLGVLLEEAELEALVQLQLPDVPHLVEILPGGVELIQQSGHLEAGSQASHSVLLIYTPLPPLIVPVSGD